MFAFILYTHILFAVVMGLLALYALSAIARRRHEKLPDLAKLLSVLMLAEAASGSLLGLLSPEFSVAHFCINVGAYIGAFLLVEFLIFAALKKHPSLVFPHFSVRTSAGFSLAAFAFVILARTTIF